jgi:hypothetical protein
MSVRPRTASSDDTRTCAGKAGRPAGAAVAAIALFAALAPAGAGAQSGNGGMEWTPRPEIVRVACVRSCVARERPRAGGTVRVTGRNLEGVREVVFLGGAGTSDDLTAAPRRRGARSLLATVPLDARSGAIALVAANDVRSRPSRRLAVMPPPAPISRPELSPAPGPREPGAPRVETGTSSTRLFTGSERGIAFSFRLSEASTVQVDVVRAADGAAVRSWTPPAGAGEVVTVRWDGLDPAGAVQPQGRYLFRLVARSASGAQARSAQVQDVQRDAFDLYDHVFPVRARHDYGGDMARFGAGRDGHSHQGHDVFAACGARLAAARGGVVKAKRYHSAAGHYVVIDGERTGVDYAYMHLQDASPFEEGDRVYTGQTIGRVGDTGRASGCHLHFEMWSEPGWYSGGSPFDPLPHLQAWDAYS